MESEFKRKLNIMSKLDDNHELDFLIELPNLEIDNPNIEEFVQSQEDRLITKKVLVTFELEDNQAWIMAQLVKRITFTHFQELSDPASSEEPYIMRSAIILLQDALEEAGYAPR